MTRMTRQGGLGKFEFAVVLVILGILAHILLDRLIALEQETERLEVELTIRHINTSIRLAVAERIMRGEEAGIAALQEANPLTLLGSAVTLRGEQPDLPGWHYDKASRTLSYVPRQPEAFYNLGLEWRLRGRQDEIGRIVGLRLEPIETKPLK